jgi:L-Ala-D/L-Glu epimerase
VEAEVVPYWLPFKEPYVTARGRLTRREMVLLRLRDEDGVEGLGEAVPLSLRSGVTIETVVKELEEPDPPLASLSAPARCALSTALLDLEEKRDDPREAGRIVREKGGRRAWAREILDPQPVRCNATLVTGPPAEVAAEAERWAADGFGTFKLKVGAGEDVEQVRAVREALGPEAKIRLDANASWSLEEATAILTAVQPLGIELVEQPVETIAEAAELARRVDIPLAGDESIVTLDDALRSRKADAFSLTGIKISKVGGIDLGQKIGVVLAAYVASALDGPVGIAAGRRLGAELDRKGAAAGHPGLAHGLATQRLFAETIAAEECALEGDLLHEAPGPGLGIVIDEDSLRHHRL